MEILTLSQRTGSQKLPLNGFTNREWIRNKDTSRTSVTSVGQSEGLLICRSLVRFRLNPRTQLPIAFITFNGSLVPLIEGLCSSNPKYSSAGHLRGGHLLITMDEVTCGWQFFSRKMRSNTEIHWRMGHWWRCFFLDRKVLKSQEQKTGPGQSLGSFLTDWFTTHSVQWLIWVGRSYSPHKKERKKERNYSGSVGDGLLALID